MAVLHASLLMCLTSCADVSSSAYNPLARWLVRLLLASYALIAPCILFQHNILVLLLLLLQVLGHSAGHCLDAERGHAATAAAAACRAAGCGGARGAGQLP
jgi:hypothetical protein